MATYRAFVLREDGGYARYIEISAACDEQACQIATLLNLGAKLDLWCGGRFVRQFGQQSRNSEFSETPAQRRDREGTGENRDNFEDGSCA